MKNRIVYQYLGSSLCEKFDFRARKLVWKRAANQPVSGAYAAQFRLPFPCPFPEYLNAPLVSDVYNPTETGLGNFPSRLPRFRHIGNATEISSQSALHFSKFEWLIIKLVYC